MAYLVGFELAYLVLVNAALYLPVTQGIVNSVRPDKFAVSWQSAWSWYPFRVHARGVAANGQSRSQQWQFEATRASASVSVLPLVLKRVWVRNVQVENVSYRQRPRLKPDKDFSARLPYFPDITGREVSPAITAPRPDKRPWHISVSGAAASGEHDFWIYEARGSAVGTVQADLTFETRGGPLTLDISGLDLALDPLFLNRNHEVFSGGRAQGGVAFAPFVPRENKGVSLLRYLSLDLQLDVDFNSLDFLNLLLVNAEGIAVAGSGRSSGRLRYHRGEVQDGTDFAIAADRLQVGLFGHSIAGHGGVFLGEDTQGGGDHELAFVFDDLQVFREQDSNPILAGENLRLGIAGAGWLVPERETAGGRRLSFLVDNLALPDLSGLQHYLPQTWPFELRGGNGTLDGRVDISTDSVHLDLTLESSGAELEMRGYRFGTDLDVALKVHNASVGIDPTRVDGSYIRLSRTQLRRLQGDTEESWDASVVVNSGQFSSQLARERGDGEREVDLIRSQGLQRANEWLEKSLVDLDIEAEVSSLGWLAVLLQDDYKVNISGSGKVAGTARLVGGWPAPGTDFQVTSRELAVDVLDYTSKGDGVIDFGITQGEKYPDWSLGVTLGNADFRRTGEDSAYIQDVSLDLAATIPAVRVSESKPRPSALQFVIRSASVTDLSTFNAYLPSDGSLRFGGGSAELTADIVLKPDDADGWLRLRAQDAEAVIGAQAVMADIALDVLLAGGVPRDMAFDITGSRLVVDKVRVAGENAAFSGDYWSAALEVEHGESVWTRPPMLDLQVGLLISDSRPVVSMFQNYGWSPDFIARLLTLEDIQGHAEFGLDGGVLRIHEATATAEKLEIGARGVIAAGERDAMLYLRYGKADALLKFQGDDKNLDILRARDKYDAFDTRGIGGNRKD